MDRRRHRRMQPQPWRSAPTSKSKWNFLLVSLCLWGVLSWSHLIIQTTNDSQNNGSSFPTIELSTLRPPTTPAGNATATRAIVGWNVVTVHPLPDEFQWHLLEDMPYKRFKTYILEYLLKEEKYHASLRAVQYLYYLDIDIVVGRPLKEWFELVEEKHIVKQEPKHDKQLTSQLIFFQGNYPWRPLQGGQFLAQRDVSDLCLQRWRHYIDANPRDPKDQSALTLVLHEFLNATANGTIATPPNICHITIMPQQPHLVFVNKTLMKHLVYRNRPSWWVRLIHRQWQYGSDFFTLMHLKNTEDAQWISSDLQQEFFQQVLQLEPEQAKNFGKAPIRPSRVVGGRR